MRTLCLLVLVSLLCFRYVLPLVGWHAARRWLARPAILPQPSTLTRAPDPGRVLRDVNAYRRQHGLAPLRYSATCAAAARLQADYNATHNLHGHDNPALPIPHDRLQVAGHTYAGTQQHWGENALRYTLSRDPKHSAGWLVFHLYHISSHHDRQMLDPRATVFGTCSIVDTQGVLYNAEIFAN